MVSSSRSQKTRQTLFLCDACGQTFEEKFNMKEHTNTNHEFLEVQEAFEVGEEIRVYKLDYAESF